MNYFLRMSKFNVEKRQQKADSICFKVIVLSLIHRFAARKKFKKMSMVEK